jgi:hypothetical protein
MPTAPAKPPRVVAQPGCPVAGLDAIERIVGQVDPGTSGPVPLECFTLSDHPPPLAPARADRTWMDRVYGRHPYRCLPMAIANGYGWEILCPAAFEVRWTGGATTDALILRQRDGAPHFDHFAVSNFGYGIVTFHPGYLFRTPPGWHLFATGPMNDPKHGAGALSGVIETDWLPYPFTMNWKLTRPGTVSFEKGEPFCLIYPVRQGDVERMQPQIKTMADEPDLNRQHEAWRSSRAEFKNRNKNNPALQAKEAWQRYYFTGKGPDGEAKPITHQHKLRTTVPIDLRLDNTDPTDKP